MFNVIWVLLYVFLLQDLADSTFTQKIPFGKLLLAIGFTILFLFCSIFALFDILNFISLKEWINFLPLPTFIILTIITILFFLLAARFYGKGEAEFTGGGKLHPEALRSFILHLPLMRYCLNVLSNCNS